MDPENTLRYPGYQVFNFRLDYEWKCLEGWAKVLNLANTVYATSAEKTAYSTAYRPRALRTLYLASVTILPDMPGTRARLPHDLFNQGALRPQE